MRMPGRVRTTNRPRVHLLACSALLASLLTVAAGGWPANTASAAPSATENDPAAAQLAQDYGLSYTEAIRRVERQTRVAALAADLTAALPDKFGGLWTDQANGGGVVVYTTAPDRRFAQSARNAGLDSDVSFRSATHARSLLTAAYEYIAARLEAAQSPDAPLGVSDDQGRNVVSLDSAPGKALTPVQQSLYDDARNRFGDAVVRSEVPVAQAGAGCAWPSCDAPLRGGLWINPTTSSGNLQYCTSGFNVVSRSDGKAYLLTAGHCMNDGLTWYEKQLDGIWHTIGSRQNSYFSSTGDAAIVAVANPAGWSPQGIVYVRASGGAYPTTENPSYSVKYLGSANTGDYVCHTGATIGTRCGQVQIPLASWTYDSVTVGNLAKVGYTSCAGDSGGPSYRANTAYGIMVALSSDAGTVLGPNGYYQTCGFTSWYSLISPALNNLNVGLLAGP